MKIIIESTTKIVELNDVPCRVWEGETDTGVKIFALIPRVAHDQKEPQEVHRQFARELIQSKAPSAEMEAIPARLVM